MKKNTLTQAQPAPHKIGPEKVERSTPGTSRVEDSQIERIRRFNRFFTQRIGVLDLMDADLSLSAARVLFEIDELGQPAATDIAHALGLDPGYLSRLLRQLTQRELVRKRPSAEDGRRQILSLSRDGRRIHERLTERANAGMRELLQPLSKGERAELTVALNRVERLMGAKGDGRVRIREYGPGDLGWVLQRHGELYADHHGFDHRFEALVAKIVSTFTEHRDPLRDRLWIAEVDGERAGSIMHVHEEGRTSRLRLFLVDPRCRGRGVGSQLLDTCLDFSRRKGYQAMVLSTVSALDAARRLYEKSGFVLTKEEKHSLWSVAVVEQDWRLDLRREA